MTRDELKRRQRILGRALCVLGHQLECDLDPPGVLLADLERVYRDVVENLSMQGKPMDDEGRVSDA